MRRYLIILFLGISVALNAQVSLLIEGIDSTVTTNDGYSVPRAVPTALIFRNNKLTTGFSTGYLFLAGDDDYSVSTAHNLDGAVIHGNEFIWNGSTQGVHGVMVGYNTDYDIKYNYINNTRYGFVHEGGYADHTRMVNTSCYIAYNIIKNGPYYSIVEKGYDGTMIYNNTFYNDLASKLAFIFVKSSDTGGITEPYPTSKNIKIKNNIFYSTSDTYAIKLGTSGDDTEAEMDTVGFECDYNIYYYPNHANHEPIFAVNDVTVTWTQWRAMGYDEHSVIVDPNFINTDTFVPTARLDYGVDVGVDYGLATTADWVVDQYPDTTIQGSTWQVGAIVYNSYHGDYFVAPWGNNNNPGTYEQPWATWGKAFNSTAVQPGDTVYIRGGIYSMTTDNLLWPYTPGSPYSFTRNGTIGNYVHYFAYPGETPILDCSNITLASGQNRAVVGNDLSYVHVKGLTIRNVKQAADGSVVRGWTLSGSNIIIENCTAHNTGGWGFLSLGSDIQYLNCDSYANCDSLSVSLPGNDGVGFQNINQTTLDGTVYYKNCRGWLNGDQGFSATSIAYVEFDSCWSFNNGQLQGEGHGFKMASVGVGGDQPPFGPLKRKYTNNLAVYNRANGWTTNDNGELTYWMQTYNNTSYRNGHPIGPMGSAYGFLIYNTTSVDSQELARTYRNNISFDNESGNIGVSAGGLYTHSNNSWDGGATITAGDFLALPASNEAGIALLMAPRGADGSLPSLGNYFQLAEGSDAIDAGVDVGLEYTGTAPDLGAYELESDTTILVDVIAVAPQSGDATITTYHGSKQLVATVLPFNATNQTVTWSVVGIHASINQTTGLLTAISDGTVLAIATATDGSNVSGSLEVTISNQTPPAPSGSGHFKKVGNQFAKVGNQRAK